MANPNINLRCSFCDKGHEEVKKIVVHSPKQDMLSAICNECTVLCAGLIAEDDPLGTLVAISNEIASQFDAKISAATAGAVKAAAAVSNLQQLKDAIGKFKTNIIPSTVKA